MRTITVMLGAFVSPALAGASAAGAPALEFGSAGRLADPVWVHAGWGALLVVVLALAARSASRRAMANLGDPALVAPMIDRAGAVRRAVRTVLVALAVVLVAVGLSRPQMGERTREVEQRGRDLVFVIDVSKSMLARDLAPNRLERAKIWINDLVDELGGDRVGLVAFAGAPTIKVPLTQDRAFFRLALDRLDPDSAPRGGTMIGDAIRKVLDDVFEARDEDGTPVETGRFRDIILITDGEDQESFPVRAAEQAGELGVRIIALGLGDSTRGTPVPMAANSEQFVRFNGEEVLSKLDSATLAEIAGAVPGNAFLEVGTNEIDLAQVYRDLIASAEQTSFGTAEVTNYEERFVPFLACGLALLVIEMLIGDGRRRA